MIRQAVRYGTGIFIIGLVLAFVGFFSHGMKSVSFNKWRPVIVSQDKNIKSNYKINNFNSMSLDVRDVNLEIKTGSKFKVKYTGSDSVRPSVSVDSDKRLVVRQDHNAVNNFIINFVDVRSKKIPENKLEITIPEDMTLTYVRVVGNDSKASISGLKVNSLELLSSDTDFILTSLNVNSVNIENHNSDVKINNTNLLAGTVLNADSDIAVSGGSLRNIEFTVTDGDVTFNNLAIAGGNLKVTDGNTHINNSQVTNNYTVNTTDGDAVVSNVTAGMYVSKVTDGDNLLYNQKSSAENSELSHGSDSSNVLKVETSDGNNHIN